MKDILIVAGEPSADAYAARLVEELHRLDHLGEIRFFGMGGPGMEREGVHLISDFRRLAHIGPWEAIAHLPRYWKVFRQILDMAKKRKPRVAVLLDFPDFNLPLARRLKLLGIKVFYYISPQVWAWRSGRVEQIARWVDRMFVIFPFEVDFYQKQGVHVEFIGHPLLERHEKHSRKGVLRRMLRVPRNIPVVALFPGSRSQEVRRLLPPMLGACALISGQHPCHFAIVKAPDLDAELLQQIWQDAQQQNRLLADEGLPISLVDIEPEEALADCDVAIVKSGTSTLQAAISGTPFVMVYKLSWPSWLTAKWLVHAPFACIVNLIAGKRVVPELLQQDACPEKIGAEILHLLESSAARRAMRAEFAKIRENLGAGQPSATLASLIASDLDLSMPHSWTFPKQTISQYVH